MTIALSARVSAWMISVLLALGTTLPGLVRADPATPATPEIREAMARAVAVVKPALVRIHVVSVSYTNGREVKSEEYGSGVIIDKQGDIVTNHHVAGNASYITCTLTSKEELEADLVGSDALTDLSVIKLHAAAGREFPFASFGDSSLVKPGDRVFAMGSPLAYSQSVTMGVVSNTELVMPEEYASHWLMLDGEDVGSIIRWIAHDARILPGNSGGPLVNPQGEVIGINEVDVGLGGAIPGNLARGITEQLLKQGKITRSWLGISVQPLLKSTPAAHGILLTGTVEDSPAEKAGLQSGDILTQLGDIPIDVRYPEALPPFNLLVMSLPANKPVSATVLRGGKEQVLTLTPVERPPSQNKEQELQAWGMCASTLGLLHAKDLKRKEAGGVIVTSLRSGGPADAAKPALSPDDLILKVAGKPINSLADLQRITQETLAGKTEAVPMLVSFERHGDRYLTVVRIGRPEVNDQGQERAKAWLPIAFQVLTRDLATALGVEGRGGVRVTRVYPNTTAQQAGLQVDDLITAIDKVPIEASEPEDIEVLPDMIRQGYEIGAIVNSRKLPQLLDSNDETDNKHDLRIVLELKPGSDPEPVMTYLYKHTSLEQNFGYNATCLIPEEHGAMVPARLSLVEILRQFLAFRLATVRRRLEFDLRQLEARIHLLEGFAIIFNDLDRALKIIRNSSGKRDACDKLLKAFSLLDEAQTMAILEMQLYKISQLEINSILGELEEKRAAAEKIRKLLASEKRLWSLIRTELEAFSTQFADKRRTAIGSSEEIVEFDASVYIVRENTNVVLTREGWIKRVGRLQNVETTRVREGDVVLDVIPGSTVDNVIYFGSDGVAHTLPIESVPVSSGYGEPISKHVKMGDGVTIVAALTTDARFTPSDQDMGDDLPHAPYFIALTAKGQIMRLPLGPFRLASTKSGRKYCRPAEGDRVVWVELVRDATSMFVATKNARVIHFAIDDIPILSGAGKGVRGIKLSDAKDEVLGAAQMARPSDCLRVKTSGDKILVFGQMKYEITSRGGKGIRAAQRSTFIDIVRPDIVLIDWAAIEAEKGE